MQVTGESREGDGRPGGGWSRSPGARAAAAVALTCLFVVLVAWASLLGPDEVFTGPGPQPSTVTTTSESCIPLPTTTAADGTVTTQVPPDASERNYCQPPAPSISDYRDVVDDAPLPLWLKVVIGAFLLGVVTVVVGIVLYLLVALVRELRDRRREEERPDVAFDVMGEPGRVAEQVARDAEEQVAVLRAGDPRNAIVAAWHRFELQGARAGVERRSSETSSEYALRVLDLADADSAPVTRLAELYREARFSDHPVTEEHRERALRALDDIRRSLGVTS